MHTRTLLTAVAIAALALVLPSPILEASPAVWRWLGSFEPGTFAAAEGRLRGDPVQDREIVVLGSSVAVIDVRHDTLSRDLGRPVVPAGIMAAQLCTTAMLAPEILARTPRTLLVLSAPADLAVCEPEQRQAYDLRIAARAFGLWPMLTDDRLLAAAVGDWSVLVRHRAVPTLLRNGRGPGWTRHPQDEGRLDDAAFRRRLRMRVAEVRGLEFDMARSSPQALLDLVERAQEAGTEVILAPAPVHPALIGRATPYPASAWHPEHVALLDEIGAVTGARVLPTDALGHYRSADFMDPAHLLPRGQARFTAALVEALR